jgi:hypothetical protein
MIQPDAIPPNVSDVELGSTGREVTALGQSQLLNCRSSMSTYMPAVPQATKVQLCRALVPILLGDKRETLHGRLHLERPGIVELENVNLRATRRVHRFTVAAYVTGKVFAWDGLQELDRWVRRGGCGKGDRVSRDSGRVTPTRGVEHTLGPRDVQPAVA